MIHHVLFFFGKDDPPCSDCSIFIKERSFMIILTLPVANMSICLVSLFGINYKDLDVLCFNRDAAMIILT